MWRMTAIVLLMCPAGVLLAQDGPRPDQLKRMYDDALVQLRSAQDRKNDLANENDVLKAKIAEMNKTIDRLRSDAMEAAERTYTMRVKLAAWEEFIQRDARVAAHWSMFLDRASTAMNVAGGILDRDWPMSAEGAAPIIP
jgi:predicted nuclease with TOPRIM domain